MTKLRDKDALSAVISDMAKHRQNSIIFDGTAGNEMMPPSSGFAQSTIVATRAFMAWVAKGLLRITAWMKKRCYNLRTPS